MKTKSKLWLGVCTVALCLGFMAFGVYSALSATLNLSGNLGFNMHNAIVEVSGTISPVAEKDSSNMFIPTTKEIKRAAMGGEQETISNLNLGDLYFYAQEDMVFDFSFKNLGYLPITMTITIDLGENADKISIVEGTEYLSFTNNTYENYIFSKETKQVKFALSLNDTSVQLDKNAFNIEMSFAEEVVTLTDGAYEGIKYTLDNTTPIASTSSANPSFLSSSVTPLSNNTIYTASVSGYDSTAIANFPNAKIQPFILSDGNLYMVTSIRNYVFMLCSNLTSVTIPNSVTSIGDSAFFGCGGLTGTLNIPNSVTSIGSSAFNQCTKLTSVTIGNSVTSIGKQAFYNCTGLTGTLNIPNSVTSIGSDAFSGCSNLQYNTDTENDPNEMLKYLGNESNNYLYLWGVTDTSLTTASINSKTKFIANSVFSSCTSLTSVTIPNSVTSIGGSAFQSCTGLTSISIPNSVTSIGDEVFYGCKGLTSVTIPNSLTYISSSAFYNCSKLTSVTIPNSVTSIDSWAFYNCGLTSVTIPDSVTSIGTYAFQNCSLTSVTIPDSVTSIGTYAFSSCKKLTSVTIGNGVKIISDYSFKNCSNLNSVTIGNSVTSIGTEAFQNCSNLTTVDNKSTHITVTKGATNNGYVGCWALYVTNP